MNGKLTDNDGKVEQFELSSGDGLLSAKIDALRVQINDRLTDYCNSEKAARLAPGESVAKKTKTED